MDTFFATKKDGQSSCGHTCCQGFVTDKGFLYVVPMQRKLEVLQAIKQFAKEIGAPTLIIADMSGEQMSHNVWKFCNNIGTTLWALEEGTPWSNKAELYIGLLKEAVRKDMRESNSPEDPPMDDPTSNDYLDDDDEMDGPVESPDHEDILDSMGRILEQQPAFDKIINVEVMIQTGDEMAMGKVARRSLDADGRTTGTYHDNPFLNTITYDVEFSDGQIKEYGTNIIAENMLTQVDSDRYSLSLMDSIIDHKRNPSQAIPMEDKYTTTKSGQKRLRKTTI